MAPYRKRGNKAIDLESQGLRARWAEITHHYDSQDRLSTDSDAIRLNVYDYMANIASDVKYFVDNGKFRGKLVDSDVLALFTTNRGADIPDYWERLDLESLVEDDRGANALSNLDLSNDSGAFRAVYNFLYKPESLYVDTAALSNTVNNDYINLQLLDSEGRSRNVNANAFLKNFFRRFVEYDEFEKTRLQELIVGGSLDDSEYLVRLATLHADTIDHDSDALHENIFSLFKYLENEYLRQIGRTPGFTKYGVLFDSDNDVYADSDGNDYVETQHEINPTRAALRRLISRAVIDGILDEVNDSETTENGVTFYSRQIERLISSITRSYEDSENARQRFVENVTLQYFDDSDTSKSADQRKEELNSVWYAYQDYDSDRWGTLNGRILDYYETDSDQVQNLWDILINHFGSTMMGLSGLSDIVLDGISISPDSDQVTRLFNFWVDEVGRVSTDSDAGLGQYQNEAANNLIDLIYTDSDATNPAGYNLSKRVTDNYRDDSDLAGILSQNLSLVERHVRQHSPITADGDTVVILDMLDDLATYITPFARNISVYHNGILQISDQDFDDRGEFVSDSSLINHEVEISVNHTTREIELTFVNPLSKDDIVTISYNTHIETTETR